MLNRRRFVQQMTALASISAAGALLSTRARAQTAKLRVGLMLPYTGTFAALGTAITNGFKLAVADGGGKLGGREIEYFTVDDESEPAKATDNANKLIQRDKVDVLIGTVHSGVVMAMVKVARDTNTLLLIPNAGANAATGGQCAPNVFRTSPANWQPAHPMGKVMADKGRKKVVTLTWKYDGGEESVESFKEAFTKQGGSIVKGDVSPFPQRRVSALPDRDRLAQAGRRVRLFRGRRGGQAGQGLRRRGAQGKDPAIRQRLSHRRHARSAG